jgi:large subunit ribosomal protein L19
MSITPALAKVQELQLRQDVPDFKAGDTVRVHVRIREGEKDRVQVFEGVCIGRHGNGLSSTFTVRKESYGVGVERVFPLHSPRIERIEVKDRGRVRRAKLFYLRKLTGKKARIRSQRDIHEQ